MYSDDLIIPSQEIKRRINLLKKALQKNNIDYALIQQNADMFYFTGIVQQGIVLISNDKDDIFFVKKDYNLATKFSNFPIIECFESTKILKKYIKEDSIIALESDVIPLSTAKFLERLLIPKKVVDISPIIKNIRAIKSDIEINFIKEASFQYRKLTEELPKFIKPGKKEDEIFIKAIEIMMSQGHQGFMRMRSYNQEMFFGHIFGSKNGLALSYLDAPTNGLGIYPSFPQGSSKLNLVEGNLLNVDIVACYNGYHSDQARPFIIGEFIRQEFKDNFYKCIEILNETLNVIRPGVLWEEPFNKALEIAKKLNVYESFMVNFSNIKFVGHGIGVEVDEFPFLAKGFTNEFETNMVFAFEPKIFITDKGVVGIENTYRVTDNGVEKLTQVEDKIFSLPF